MSKSVLVDADVIFANKDGRSYVIKSRNSGKQYNTISPNIRIPLLEGDHIICRALLANDIVTFTEIPIVYPDRSKEGILKYLCKFFVRSRENVQREAREIFDFLSQKGQIENVLNSYTLTEEDLKKHPILKLIFKKWNKEQKIRSLYLLGLTPDEIRRVNKNYIRYYSLLLSDPFLVLKVSLETCDKIIKLLRRQNDPLQRRTAEIARVIRSYTKERQWSCVPLSLLRVEINDWDDHVQRLLDYYKMVIEYDCIYLPNKYEIETGFARKINELNKVIDDFEPEIDQKASEDQILAIKTALNNGISVIYGEAGTGKTSCLKWLLNIIFNNSVVVSFTGKAVARIKEVVKNVPIMTLHRYLILQPDVKAKITTIIVDETSMVTCRMMFKIINSTPNLHRIVFVGDPNQLPTITWGGILDNLIKTPSIPKVKLNTQHRHPDDMINKNSTNIITGITELEVGDNFYVIKAFEEENCIPILQSHEDVNIITPFNKVIPRLNEIAREIYNPPALGKKELEGWRVGDKVMMLENNYDINVMNGEEGIVVNIDYEVEVKFGDKVHSFPVHNKNDDDENSLSTKMLIHSWAKTVHKVQGSEYDYTIFYVPPWSSAGSFFCQNLVYTAITRAKKKCWIIGDISTVQKAINCKPRYRYEHMFEKLK